MKKPTNWTKYYDDQLRNPRMRQLVEDELRALRIGARIATLRQEAGLTQTQLAAKAGMSAPNISRIESDVLQNLTLRTLVKVFGALDHDLSVTPRRRAHRVRRA